MLQRLVLITLLIAAPLTACSRRQPPPPTPGPAMGDTAGEGARRAAEQERMRREAETGGGSDADARRRAEEAASRARAILEEIVFFEYDEAALTNEAEETLGRKVPVLRSNPGVRLRIVGHADERGSLEYNLALGMRRSNSVRDYLAGFGIDASRFETTSMGEDMPLEPGSNESAWARNRRAEFVITSGGTTLSAPGS